MSMRPYDGTVIDPFWIDITGRDDHEFTADFYRTCCRASGIFQLGEWRAKWRAAEARNDFEAMDRLDRQFEMIGV